MTSVRKLLCLFALVCVAGFCLTLFVALRSAHGIELDRKVLERVSGTAPVPVKTAGVRVLQTIDVAILSVALLALAFLALVRKRAGRAVAAAAVVALSVGSAELLKPSLGRLGLVPAGRPATFPSGHTAVAVSLGLAFVLAAPSFARPVAALAGAAYGASIAFAVVDVGSHYPSDAVAAFFLCGFWAALSALPLQRANIAPALSVRGLLAAAGAVALALAIAGVLATRHSAALATARSHVAVLGVAGAFGLLSVTLFALFTPLAAEGDGG